MSHRSEILAIVAAKTGLDVAQLVDSATLADLNISSLDVVEVVFALEDKFDVQIPFNANATAANRVEFNTVGDVVGAVEKLLAEKGR